MDLTVTNRTKQMHLSISSSSMPVHSRLLYH
jgi:hypothetical protein